MANFTVRQGKRYRATISLGLLERFASNEMIAKRFDDIGFSEVLVSGNGSSRVAEALWALPDADGDIPAQVTELVEI